MRMMVMPSWWEPINDNDDANRIAWDKLTLSSVEMQSLYKALDLAQSEGIDITMVATNGAVTLLTSSIAPTKSIS